MDLKRLVTHFAYKIEPKPEGGFIARATDPAVPPLEATTREELRQMIQQKILKTLSAEFPALKLPAEGKHLELAFHIEHTPGGGYEIHSADPKAEVIGAADQKEFESRFLEKFLNFAGRHLVPELSQALAAQVGSANIKVVLNQKTAVTVNSGPEGISFGASKSPALADSAWLRDLSPDGLRLPDTNTNPANQSTIETMGNAPITPETGDSWKIFSFMLLVLLISALVYFVLHYR